MHAPSRVTLGTLSETIDPATARDRTAVVEREFRGEFWKPCPGTTGGYRCCGYQILTPMVGCAMYCRYCILQSYLDHQCRIRFTNLGDLEREVREKLSRRQGVVRFGTGEFGDSLHHEDELGLSCRIARILEPYPNVVVEFKTKSATVEPLSSIGDKSKVVVGFSMNTPAVIRDMEQGTASLEQRLAAACRCEEMGFRVAFHFDPMIHYPGWENDYRGLVRAIFGSVAKPQNVAWWSLGGLRAMPALKKLLRSRGEESPLFAGEMILGTDRKYRYFRPIRVAFYRAVQDEIERHWPQTTLYLCMESPEVWQEAGMEKRVPEGLVSCLDRRAEELLGLRHAS